MSLRGFLGLLQVTIIMDIFLLHIVDNNYYY